MTYFTAQQQLHMNHKPLPQLSLPSFLTGRQACSCRNVPVFCFWELLWYVTPGSKYHLHSSLAPLHPVSSWIIDVGNCGAIRAGLLFKHWLILLDDPDYGFSHQDLLMRLLIEAAMFRHVQTSAENKEARRFIKTAEGYLHAGKKSNGVRKRGEC